MSIIAKNIAEIADAKGEFRAGGTDFMDRLRHGTAQPEIVDISRLPGLSHWEFAATGATIGALNSVEEVADHPKIMQMYPGLAIAAGSLATPQVRRAASLGGSLTQRNRCWYFRHEDFSCFKKGGDACPARTGNHQFGVCNDLGPCVFPHPSTLGMVLMAYGAKLGTSQNREISLADFFGAGTDPSHDHFLREREIVTEILLPAGYLGEKAGYFRSISRAAAEWPLVEVAVMYTLADGNMSHVRIGIGGVANVPLLLPGVARALEGNPPSEELFMRAARLATEGWVALPQTQYKLDLVPGTIFEALRRAEAGITEGEG